MSVNHSNKVLVLFICLFGYTMNGYSQNYKQASEIGVFGGGAYYIGELNHEHFLQSKVAFGAVFRYNLSTRHNLRFTAIYGSVYGNDANSNNAFENIRDLNFNSSLFELAVGYEINFFKYAIKDMKFPFSPYFFYQLAYTRINPQTNYDNIIVDLQPLGTEGQNSVLSDKNSYSLNQITVPLGIGIKFNLRKRVAISIEYGIRKTFTDYLDDVSGAYVNTLLLADASGPLAGDLSNKTDIYQSGMNRGNPSNKDWYSFYGFMITFKPFKYDVCKAMKGN